MNLRQRELSAQQHGAPIVQPAVTPQSPQPKEYDHSYQCIDPKKPASEEGAEYFQLVDDRFDIVRILNESKNMAPSEKRYYRKMLGITDRKIVQHRFNEHLEKCPGCMHTVSLKTPAAAANAN